MVEEFDEEVGVHTAGVRYKRSEVANQGSKGLMLWYCCEIEKCRRQEEKWWESENSKRNLAVVRPEGGREGKDFESRRES